MPEAGPSAANSRDVAAAAGLGESPFCGRSAGRDRFGEGRDAVRQLLRGLHAGDLETLLLTVAMAAEENRMPCADPDEVRRILDFLARLAAYDATTPPPRLEGGDAGPDQPPHGR